MNYIKLFHTDLISDYQNTLDFDSKASQAAYFDNLAVADFSEQDITVIKELEEVRIYGNYNALQAVNYAYFENDIDGVIKGYYAFITGVKWCGIGVVGLSLQIDYIQTYLFDYKLNSSYIERGHVDRKNNGIPNFRFIDTVENVDKGEELIYTNKEDLRIRVQDGRFSYYLYVLYIVTTEALVQAQEPTKWGISQPYYIYMLPIVIGNNQTELDTCVMNVSVRQKLGKLKSVYDKLRSNNKVLSIYLSTQYNGGISGTYVNDTSLGKIIEIDAEGTYPVNIGTSSDEHFILAIRNTARIDNNYFLTTIKPDFSDEVKLDCFPYKFYVVSNQRGNELIIKPQYCDIDNGADVVFIQSISGISKEGYGLTNYLQNFDLTVTPTYTIPELPLNNDAYINAIQNRKNSMLTGIASSLVSNGFSTVAAAVAGNVGGAARSAIGGVTGLINSYAQIQDLKDTPDSVRKPGNDWLFEYFADTLGIKVYEVSITPEAKLRVADYFQKFGYSIGQFYNINLKSRKAYNFVKTVQANITGNFTDTVRRTLQNIFDNGIRFWHVRDGQPFGGIGNYNVDNSEVSHG